MSDPNSNPMKGRCLCGGIQFEIRPPYIGMNNCYCSRCRRASGSSHGTFLHTTCGRFRWVEGEKLVHDYKPNDGDARPFCTTCGCRVPSVLVDDDHVIVPAGLLDMEISGKPLANIYVASKSEWSTVDESIPCFDEGAGEAFWRPYIDRFTKALQE